MLQLSVLKYANDAHTVIYFLCNKMQTLNYKYHKIMKTL